MLRILLGRGVANHPGLIEMLETTDAGIDLRIGVHHLRRMNIDDSADFVQERLTSTSQEYVSGCVMACRSYRADFFWPGRDIGAIAGRVDDFAAIGTKVILCGSAASIAAVEDKLHFSKVVDIEGTRGVPSIEFRDSAGFERAYSAIRSSGDIVCFKPRHGTFGRGFRVVREELDIFDELLDDPGHRIDLADARRRFSSKPTFRPMLAMPWLAGEEWSVDCFRARDGSRFIGIGRKKIGDEQRVTTRTELIGLSENLARQFGLHGLFNCQFRYHLGKTFVLEVNPRPAGGIGATALTGINLIETAIRDLLGLPPMQQVWFPDITVTTRHEWRRSD